MTGLVNFGAASRDHKEERDEGWRRSRESTTQSSRQAIVQQGRHGATFSSTWGIWEQLQRKHVFRMDSGLGIDRKQHKSSRVKSLPERLLLIWLEVGARLVGEEEGLGVSGSLVGAREERGEKVLLAIFLSFSEHSQNRRVHLSISGGRK